MELDIATGSYRENNVQLYFSFYGKSLLTKSHVGWDMAQPYAPVQPCSTPVPPKATKT